MNTDCPACRGVVEYQEDDAGADVICPHCGQPMRLPVPGEPPVVHAAEDVATVRPIPEPAWIDVVIGRFVAAWRSRVGVRAGVGLIVVIAALAVVWLGRRYWPAILETAGSATAALVLLAAGCAAAVVAVLWLVFPVFVLVRLNRIVELLELQARRDR